DRSLLVIFGQRFSARAECRTDDAGCGRRAHGGKPQEVRSLQSVLQSPKLCRSDPVGLRHRAPCAAVGKRERSGCKVDARAGANLRPLLSLLYDIQDRRKIPVKPTGRIKMRCSQRFWASISSVAILSFLALALPEKPAFAADNQMVFIFGG